MILIEISIGVLLVLGLVVLWWHSKVVADNERLRELFGVIYQKFSTHDSMPEGEAKQKLSLDLMDVLYDPDCSKAESWLNEPGNVTYLSSAFVRH